MRSLVWATECRCASTYRVVRYRAFRRTTPKLQRRNPTTIYEMGRTRPLVGLSTVQRGVLGACREQMDVNRPRDRHQQLLPIHGLFHHRCYCSLLVSMGYIKGGMQGEERVMRGL